MASLKEVRGRIQSVVSTQQITKAMKMVAAAKLRRAQDRIIGMRPYANKLEGILHNLTAMTGGDAGAYAEERPLERAALVVVTSDRGLCGAFNANVCKKALLAINTDYKELLTGGRLQVVCVGKKAYDYFSKRLPDGAVDNTYVGLFGDLQFEEAKKAAEYLMEAFLNKEFDRVDIVYNEFKNVATQNVVKEQFLPAVKEEGEQQEVAPLQTDYIFEPSKEYVIKELIPKSLKIQFYKALLESNAGEHGARMTAMDKATENAGDLLKELRLVYNRTRQAAITTEILEIVAGAEALSGK